MAAPKLECEVVTLTIRLSLRSGRDDDLIEWFASLGPRTRAKAVATALREGGVRVVEAAGGDEQEDAAAPAPSSNAISFLAG